MTKDEIIKLAREADLWITSPERIDAVERFAALVAAKEREECAKLFESHWRETWTDEQCAAAIRARGDK